ncbi:MAG: NAD(P)/FAD-dependent oxidoreductase [Pseudomonadales bacterium]
MNDYDVIVIGAGIAGASIASEIAADLRVLLLERESQPGYHATGRSAAAFIPSYGHNNPSLRGLTLASYAFLSQPPSAFCNVALLRRRSLLTVCPPGEGATIKTEYKHLSSFVPNLTMLEAPAAQALVPLLRDDYAQVAMLERDVFDIDVDALHQGYLRSISARDGVVHCRAEVQTMKRKDGVWHIGTTQGAFRAPIAVNAAGAWADELARKAGVQPIGLAPMRRTAVLLKPPAGIDVSDWPLVLCNDESFYFKPDAGLILISPADEHPSAATDAQPAELDVAYAVHFAELALQLENPRVQRTWAGLRSFVADRTPVVGFDPESDGFFWLCGQGGHGIQTAPATARLAASLLLDKSLPEDLLAADFDPAWVSPARL